MLLERFYDETRVSKAVSTAETYVSHIKRFLEYLVKNNLTIENFSQENYQKYIIWMVDAKRSPAYIRLAGITIFVYMTWLKEQGVPVQDLRPPKMPRIQRTNPVSIDQTVLLAYSRVVRTLPEPYSMALLLLPVTGLRSHEIVELKIENLSWKSPWLLLTVMGKGQKERIVPILQSANPLMKSYLTGWRAGVEKTEWLFPNPHKISDPISRRTLRNQMLKIGRKIGVHLSPHMMRRTYLTMLRDRGVVGERLARLAGHSDPNFTEEKYVTKNVNDLFKELSNIDIKI